MAIIKLGTIYEVKLDNDKYVYFCRFDEFNFGLFDLVSDEKVDAKTLEKNKIIDFKSCSFLDYVDGTAKKLSIVQCDWKKVGEIDILKIKVPDMAIYDSWNQESSFNECLILRYRIATKVTFEEYKKLVKKGFIYGSIPSGKIFKKYIIRNIDNILNNKPMDSSWDTSRFHE